MNMQNQQDFLVLSILVSMNLILSIYSLGPESSLQLCCSDIQQDVTIMNLTESFCLWGKFKWRI